MESFLTFFAFVIFFVVIFLIINERHIKISPEIALLGLSLVIGVICKMLLSSGVQLPVDGAIYNLTNLKIDEILIDGMLCFMLFSGASDLKFKVLKKNFRPITLLALLTTAITTVIYGSLYYVLLSALKLGPNYINCLLLGAVISPTDPIAATGILNKLGLSDELVSIIEGESLFNDGTGVALFVFIKGLSTHTGEAGFFAIMAKEILGAIIIAALVSFLCLKLIKLTKNDITHIACSLLAVTMCYSWSERLGCSGVISSVVCGIIFATVMEKYREQGIVMSGGYYDDFWETIDKLLNYVLYILIGLAFIFVVKIKMLVFAVVSATVLNFVARYIGVFISSLFMKEVPGGYSKNQFATLMTWSGLKGGLCLALMMSLYNVVTLREYNGMMIAVFATILFTTIVQGLTVSKLYLKLEKKKKSKMEGKDGN